MLKKCNGCCWDKECQFQNRGREDLCTDEHRNSLKIKQGSVNGQTI